MLFKFCTISRDCGKSTIQKCSKINPMCFSVPNSDVLSSQGIKSSIMCFFAPIQKCSKIKSNVLHCTKFKCVIFSRDQVQYYVPLCTNSVALPFQRIKPRIMCFFAPTQMFYLLKGSNPILCVSLHQVSFNCFMLVELHQSLVAFLQMFVPAELHQSLVTLLLLPAQVVVAVFHQ